MEVPNLLAVTSSSSNVDGANLLGRVAIDVNAERENGRAAFKDGKTGSYTVVLVSFKEPKTNHY